MGGTWQAFPDRAAAESALEEGEVEAVFVVPPGFDGDVDQGRGGSLEVIGDVDCVRSPPRSRRPSPRVTGSASIRSRLNVFAALASGGDPATVMPAATAGGAPQPLADLTDITAGVRQLDGTTSTVAGMAVFFLLFTAQVGLLSLLEERRDGTLARILSTPTRPGAVLAAKCLVSVILGLASLAVLIVAGRFILGAEWGNPLGVLVLVVAAVLAAVGISALTTGLAKTPESAGNMQGIVGTVLGLLGGVFFPIGDDGGILASISALTPHHWFIRGLSDLAGGQSAERGLACGVAPPDHCRGHGLRRQLPHQKAGLEVKAVSIALSNLRRLFRDRSSIFFVFIFPLALVLLIGLQFGGSFDSPGRAAGRGAGPDRRPVRRPAVQRTGNRDSELRR